MATSSRFRTGLLAGALGTLALLGVGTLVGIETGALPAGADVAPPAIEAWAAKTSLHAAIGRETRGASDPLPPTDAQLARGARVYGANCAVCHGAADAKPSLFARGLYIAAPQLAKDGVEDDPEAVISWKLRHGIRFTAMPAFETRLTDAELRETTAFLKRMDRLPPSVRAIWEAMPSAAATPTGQ